jgi:radical SAM protein with 4Fe4S-binding SPASM domain
MRDFASSDVPQVPSGFMVERKGELCLLLHPERPAWTVVNPSGLEVVSLCDGHHTVRDIASIIASRYGREPTSVYPDVVGYLQQLDRAGMLVFPVGAGSQEGQGRATKSLHLQVTARCNLRCRHCAIAGGPVQGDGLSTARVRELIDELAKDGGGLLAITGGEPLLRADGLNLLRYACPRVKTILSTNAMLIDRHVAQALSELELAIQVSLDGASPAVHDGIRGQGAFAKAMRGVHLLQEHGLNDRLALCLTVMKPNLDDVPKVIELAQAEGIPALRLMPLQRMGRAAAAWSDLGVPPEQAESLYAVLYRQAPRLHPDLALSPGLQGFLLRVPEGGAWCRIGTLVAVDAAGDAYPCPLFTGPTYRLGNVKEMSLRQVLDSARLKQLRETCQARKNRIHQCQACHWRNFCQGSCPGSVLLERGTLWEADDLCGLRRQLYRDTIFDLAEGRQRAAGLAQEAACV